MDPGQAFVDSASGDADAATVLRLVANYAIPYLVSSIGYLSASTRDAAAPADPTDGRKEPLHGERR